MSSFRSHPSTLFLLAFFLFHLSLCTNLYPTEEIYQFPDPTVVENLAVRPDGSILTTIASAPEIYLFQPKADRPDPQLIYRFDGSNAVTGIVETSPDVFYVTVTTVNVDDGVFSPVANSSQLWRISFPRRQRDKPRVQKIADLPEVQIPNGLTALASGKRLLSADAFQGLVYIIDTATGDVIAPLSDPLFDPSPDGAFGVNGVEVKGSTLYFTNGFQNVFGKIPIDPVTGIAKHPASVIARALPPAKGYDDFAISPHGDAAYVANPGGNFIEKIDLKTGKQVIVAGKVNSTEISGPTSAAFGRKGNGKVKERVLYVTTSGDPGFPVDGKTPGGQLVAVKLPKKK